MSTTTRVKSKTSALLAAIFFLPALILLVIWVSTGFGNSGISEVGRQNQFLNYFPEWMQNFKMLHLFSLLCCIIVLYFASGSFRKHSLWIRISMMAITMASILVILFDFVQLI
ncbi:MAG: hypothetical protein ABI208_00455 [Ginsengibacter sp.]|jgi:hypothetical protein